MESDVIFLKTLADDETGKLGEMEPKRACLTLKPSLSRAGTDVSGCLIK